MRTPYSIPVFTLVLWCAACASSAPRGAQDASADVAEDAIEEDTRADATDALESDADISDAAGAVDAEDDAGTTTDGSGTDAEDVAMVDAADDIEEPEVLDCEVVGTECEPFSVACEGGDVVFCSRCGFELRREACAADEVCEDIDGAGRCRPCEGEECPVTVECERASAPVWTSTRAPSAARTAASRRPRTVRPAAVASTGPAALGGRTQAPHAPTEPPPAPASSACASARAQTPPATASRRATAVRAPATGTTATRETRSVRTSAGSRRSMMAPSASAARRAAHVASAVETGSSARELPTRIGEEPVAWAWACWAPLATIGEPCARDGDCLGGRCRTQDVGGTEVSYCAGACGADGGCPSHAECVQDPRDDGDYLCLARGNNVDCPRMETEPLRVAATAPLRRFGGGSASVCYFAR